MVKRYSKEVIDFITTNVKGLTSEALAKITNDKFGTDFNAKKMQSFKSNYNLKSDIRYNGWDKKKKLFPDEIADFIKLNAKGLYNKELTELVNTTFKTNYKISQIDSYKSNHHISSGLTGHFEKGHVPHSKGKKMSPEQYEKCKATMFKKGNCPHNHREIGSERIGKDGYLQIKVGEPKKWKQKHVYLYEQEYGPIPKGYKVIFLDKDIRNLDLKNLALVSPNELLRLNQKKRINENPDITKINLTLTKLENKITDKKKGN